MAHPASILQTALVSAWNADPVVVAALGGGSILELPRRDTVAPYVVIASHHVLARDTDLSPGWEHRMRVRVWGGGPNRAEVLTLADALVTATGLVTLSGPELWLTLVRHMRTDSDIEPKSGRARASIEWRLFTEPQA